MDWTKKLEEYRIEAEKNPVNDFRENIEKYVIIPRGVKGLVTPVSRPVAIPSAFTNDEIGEYSNKYRKIDLVYMIEKAKGKKQNPSEKIVRKYLDNMTKYALIITYLKLKGRHKQI
jgi:hypothetical protein